MTTAERPTALEREAISVSVVIPVLDERENLPALLAAIRRQAYDGPVEVLVVDGGSTDGTLPYLAAQSDVTVIANPARRQSVAMNLAIGRASGEIIVRLDARTRPEADYLAACVTALERSRAAIVGGAQVPQHAGRVRQRAIAAAMSSRVGAGPAPFRRATRATVVDTVYLGAFRRKVALDVGGYREDLRTNEDAEFARRMSAMGAILFDPAIRSTYVPRSTIAELGRQYHAYGRGRGLTVRDDPRSLRLRQAVPLFLLAGMLSPWRRPVALLYGAVVASEAVRTCRRDPWSAPWFLVCVPVMHVSWATGFLRSIVRPRTWRATAR